MEPRPRRASAFFHSRRSDTRADRAQPQRRCHSALGRGGVARANRQKGQGNRRAEGQISAHAGRLRERRASGSASRARNRCGSSARTSCATCCRSSTTSSARSTAARGGGDAKTIVEGVEMVLRSLIDFLRAQGVTPLESVGQPFDPNRHEAVDHVAVGEHPPNTVVERVPSRLPDRRAGPAAGASVGCQGANGTDSGKAKRRRKRRLRR